jgi:hypothetical protein
MLTRDPDRASFFVVKPDRSGIPGALERLGPVNVEPKHLSAGDIIGLDVSIWLSRAKFLQLEVGVCYGYTTDRVGRSAQPVDG